MAEELAHRISATAPAAPWWLVVLTGLLGLAIATAPAVAISPVARLNSTLYHANAVGTLVHEMGHATLALLTSGKVHRLEISAPDGGETKSTTFVGVRSVLTTLAGYPAEALVGLAAAHLLRQGQAAAVVTVLGVVAAAAAPFARGLLTWITVLGTLAGVALLLWVDVPLAYVLVAHVITWLLLCSGVTSVVTLVSNWWRGTTDVGDASTMQRKTGIPWPVWVLGWLALTGWCLYLGGGWLLL
ncbi:M50 family metallopeptidase [Salinifilum ghardaiensis]